jgi:hypothetical protein
MARPLKLHIIPQETFPTQRPNCAPQGVTAQEVGDMPQMAAFVYEFYIQKVQAMKSAFYVSTWYFFKNVLCCAETHVKGTDIFLGFLTFFERICKVM